MKNEFIDIARVRSFLKEVGKDLTVTVIFIKRDGNFRIMTGTLIYDERWDWDKASLAHMNVIKSGWRSFLLDKVFYLLDGEGRSLGIRPEAP